MIENPIRSLLRLSRKIPAVLTPIFILFFFLYIPLIHSNINASEKEPAAAAGVEPMETPFAIKTEPFPTKVKTARMDAIGEGFRTVFVPFVAFNPAELPGIAPKPVPTTHAPPTTGGRTVVGRKKPLVVRKKATGRTRRPANYLPPDITRGSLLKMELSITFDGGYSAYEATEILDALRARGIKTTVFLTGIFINRHPEITRQLVLDGHEVGNHLMTHPHLTSFADNFRHERLPEIDRSRLIKELSDAEELFRDVTGAEMAPLWRAPYGEINTELRSWAFTEGYLHVGWTYDREARESLDTLDWVDNTESKLYRSSTDIKSRILGFGKGSGGVMGGIILMHLGTGRKLDRVSSILGELIDDLTDRGYRFVTVSRLLEGHRGLDTALKLKKRRSYKLLSRKTRAPGPS
jgi:peptidoglycan/xylan/chitin deacetylase (PgdA/CDA1 family)